MERLAAKHMRALIDGHYAIPGHILHLLRGVVDYLDHDQGNRSNYIDQQIAVIRGWLDWIRQDSAHEDEWQQQQRQKYNLLMAAKRGDVS
jgi:hypothetical protein